MMRITSNQFQDRREAGRFLAGMLRRFCDNPDVLVLALPRGGVPVGYEVAVAIGAPLDVFLVRKLGAPGQEELAMGAIASGGVRVINEEVVVQLGISAATIETVSQAESVELRRRESEYRGDRPPLSTQGKTILLVDDGLATGSSMLAAVRALRFADSGPIVVAVPVAAQDSCDRVRSEADDVVCGMTPDPFQAVGLWYADFTQTSDEEVRQLLQQSARERGRA